MSDYHVIFGTGPLAQATMRALLKRDKKIRMINRSGKRHESIPVEVEILSGDAYDIEFTTSVTKDAVCVYQCAQPSYHEWVEKFPPLQQAILEGTATNQAKFIVAENLYMYGDTDGKLLHEELPYSAQTRKGKVRGEMSSALIEAHKAGRIRMAIARGSDFFGPGVLTSALGERTLGPLLKGKGAEVTGALDVPHTYTYISDFGEAMAILGERDEAQGQAWHVPNAPALTQRDLITRFFKEAGLPLKFSVIGKMMLRIGGIFVPEAREMIEMMYEFEKPFVVDASKFIKTFGDISTPYEESVPETVNWFREYLQGNN